MPSYDWDVVITLAYKKTSFGNDSELNRFWESYTPILQKWIDWAGWKEYGIGLEWGMEERLHFQCYFKHNKLKNKKQFTKVIKKFMDACPQEHLLIADNNPHVASAHDKKALVRYVLEPAKNRVGLLHKIDVEETYLGQDLPAAEALYDWQRQACSILESITDNRQILWFYDPSGSAGKTTLAKYLCFHKGGIPISYGKAGDILHIAAKNKSPLYVVNLPRTKGKEWGSGDIYQALEGIRDGFFMDTKYDSKPIMRNSSKIIVFANIKPTAEQLASKNRYVVYEIRNSTLTKIN